MNNMLRKLKQYLRKEVQIRLHRVLSLTNLPKKGSKSLHFASQQLVTPFSGFILSSYYISEEIDNLQLTWLNPMAKKIKTKGPVTLIKGNIIYCQVDQLEYFLQCCLPRITKPYILISGKWNLPSLIESETVNSILADGNLLSWFSQNQIFDHLPIKPFPYGMRLESTPSVLELMNSEFSYKSEDIYVPFATVHSHLYRRAKEDREFISSYMDSEKPLMEYLKKIYHSKWVVSPAGDRPDTYRHWESIALGSTPIKVLPKNFEKLFGDSALLVEDFHFLRDELIPRNNCNQNKQLATVAYWRRRVQDCERNNY